MNKSFKNVAAVHTHTCNLKNIKNKINERDICINASNFDEQLNKEKQNNITTFGKSKSNAVGGRRSRRPERRNEE